MRSVLKRIAFLAATLCVAGYVGWRYWELTQRRASALAARQAAAQLEARLDRPVSLDVHDVPLGKLLARLAREHGIAIDVDGPALASIGIKRDPPVTIAMRDVPLREALARIAGSFEDPLVAVPRSGRVLVTTPLEAEDDVVLEVYPLPPHMVGASAVTEEQFRDLVAGIFVPEVFDSKTPRTPLRGNFNRGAGGSTYTGPAAMEAVPGGLAVLQTPEVHREIKQLLAALEEVELSPDRTAPIDLDPPSAEERRIEQVLAQPVEVAETFTELKEVAERLGARFGISIRVDPNTLEMAPVFGLESSNPIAGVSLRTILRRLARDMDSTIDVRDDAVWFTSDEAVEQNRTLRVYPCADLLAPRGAYSSAWLLEVIESTISPTVWIDVGGMFSIDACGNSIVVVANDCVHDEVERLLGLLRRHAAGEDLAAQTSASRVKLETALAKNVSVEFVEKPLGELCLELSQQCGVPIALDRVALDTAGVKVTEPTTYRAHERPFAAVLSDLLDQHDLTWMIIDDALILVTIIEETEQDLRTLVYDVRHLVSPDFGPEDNDSLIEVITSIIEPTTWVDVGGVGAIQEGDGCLVVSQTDEIHRKIGQLLDALTQSFDETARFAPYVLPSLAPKLDRAIESRLDQTVALVLENERLEDFVARIADEYDLPVHVDWSLLAAADADGVFPLDYFRSVRIPDATLRSALRLALRQYECSYFVRDGGLTIATQYRCESRREARVYNVADLVRTGDGQRDFSTLIDLVTSTVAPDSWTEVGGYGAIQEFFTPYCDLLVISQTPEVFQELDRLLATLRHLREPAKFLAPLRTPAEDRIEQVLNAPTDLVFKEATLAEFAASLSNEWGVPIVIEATAMNDPYTITCELRGLPAREALFAVLNEQGLAFAVENEAIAIVDWFTTQQEFGDVRVYRWNAETDRTPLAPHEDAMIELLQQLIEPISWADLRGGGEAATIGGLVVVRQRYANQHDVAQFFEFLKSSAQLDLPTTPFDAPLSDAHRDWVVEQLHGEPADWLTRYAIYVAGASQRHAEQFVPTLIELLKRLESSPNVVLHEMVATALASYGREAESAAPILIPYVDRIGNAMRRNEYLLMLSKFGPITAPRIAQLLLDEPEQRVMAAEALMSYGVEARDQVPAIIDGVMRNRFTWTWESDDAAPRLTFGNDEPTVIDLLAAIDPGFVETRRIIAELSESPDEDTRHGAELLLRAIEEPVLEEETAP